MIRSDLRNIAIIAHVDHGKTTLVDHMLRQSGIFRENQAVQDRVMDSNDLERERGITILAKNTSAEYAGVKINIVDTPGHADFGGEVERVLKMVNGVLLLVDASEGPMPQTRFVLQKALALNHRVIVIINKIDRPDSRIDEVINEVLELLMDLGANEEQLYSPIIFCSGRNGTCSLKQEEEGTDLNPLFQTILDYIPAPEGEAEDPLRILVSSIDYNEYVGRIAIGRIDRGTIRQGQEVAICDYHYEEVAAKAKITAIYQFDGLNKTPVEKAKAGDIVSFAGIANVNIGNTVCAADNISPLPFVKISEPTVEMTFSVNNSPFAGTEGKFVTSRQLRERLFRELLKDVSLRVDETDNTDSFRVMGRGEMHLSILIETMRREGYEFQVSTPKALLKTVDGVLLEPYENLIIDVPDESMGTVMESMGARKGEMQAMHPMGSRVKIEFIIPSRGLFGYRSQFLTNTRGEGIMTSVFHDYGPYKGEIASRSTASLIAFDPGEAVPYGLYNAQERGTLFIGVGEKVYTGMVVGFTPKSEDISVNVCKKKQMTNMRASGSEDALRLTPHRQLSLEEALEFMNDDELLEITPKNFRIRKRILDQTKRMRAAKSHKDS